MGEQPLTVLDTHVWLWLVADERRLSRAAIRAIRGGQERGDLAISAITLSEIATLHLKRRARVTPPFRDWLEARLAETGHKIVPITTEIAALTVHLAAALSDPADRLIVATAAAHDARLVTADEEIQAARLVETIW